MRQGKARFPGDSRRTPRLDGPRMRRGAVQAAITRTRQRQTLAWDGRQWTRQLVASPHLIAFRFRLLRCAPVLTLLQRARKGAKPLAKRSNRDAKSGFAFGFVHFIVRQSNAYVLVDEVGRTRLNN